MDALKAYMGVCGIDKCVAYATFPDRFRDSGLMCNQNQYLAKAIEDCPDIYGFGTVDFEQDNLEEQLDEIHALSFKGIKIHPQAQEISVDGEKAFRVYEKCETLGLFISFHTGVHWHRMKDSALMLYDEVAFNFQNLRFSMEHMGGYSFFNEALAVMVNNSREGIQPRVFAGWTSITNNGDAWSISDEQLKILLKQTSENNSIFGIDFPFNNIEKTQSAIARIQNLDIPNQTKDKILGKNLADALGIEL
ncbi:hypothetical protein SDC9_137388 [bioreactor metagenome]|uniref:Amidohydrolase-related domain-containing protein n=1 Tax=bioreactor metagenome TaxID=1076179 RepID=A0A645DLV9_9ZZZZ